MKIYSFQHRAIVEAPIMEMPDRDNFVTGPYCKILNVTYYKDALLAYDHWLTTHIPVLPEHQHLFKDGQEVKEGIDYTVKEQFNYGYRAGIPNWSDVPLNALGWAKEAYRKIAIPIKQQQFPVQETWDDILQEAKNNIIYLRDPYPKMIEWLKQHYHAPIKQQVSEEDKEPLPQQEITDDYVLKLIKKVGRHPGGFLTCYRYMESQLSEALQTIQLEIGAKNAVCELYEEALAKIKEWKDRELATAMTADDYRKKIIEQAETIKSQQEEIKEWEQSFDLYHSAAMRGVEIFKQGNPDYPELSIPDGARMIAWLLEKIKSQEAEIADLRKQLK